MSATPRASAMPWASGVGAGGQAELGAGGRPGGHLQLLGHGGHGGRHRALRLLRAQHLRDAPGPRDRALRRLALRRIARRRAAAAAKAACARAARRWALLWQWPSGVPRRPRGWHALRPVAPAGLPAALDLPNDLRLLYSGKACEDGKACEERRAEPPACTPRTTAGCMHAYGSACPCSRLSSSRTGRASSHVGREGSRAAHRDRRRGRRRQSRGRHGRRRGHRNRRRGRQSRDRRRQSRGRRRAGALCRALQHARHTRPYSLPVRARTDKTALPFLLHIRAGIKVCICRAVTATCCVCPRQQLQEPKYDVGRCKVSARDAKLEAF